jgi:hypothetical protein
MGSVRGTVVGPDAASVRLARADGTSGSIDTETSRTGAFEFPDVAPGWYILSGAAPGFLETIRPIRVEDASADAGRLTFLLELQAKPGPVPILTVCEALENGQAISHRRVVIVGIFKSGMDETLRLDCPFQPVTGEVGWPSSIGLTRPSNPPDALREEVEKKRAEVLKSGPPGAQPRPERVVGLYGIFVALLGLTSAPCCRAPVETTLPPARLFGIAEKDLRVIR